MTDSQCASDDSVIARLYSRGVLVLSRACRLLSKSKFFVGSQPVGRDILPVCQAGMLIKTKCSYRKFSGRAILLQQEPKLRVPAKDFESGLATFWATILSTD